MPMSCPWKRLPHFQRIPFFPTTPHIATLVTERHAALSKLSLPCKIFFSRCKNSNERIFSNVANWNKQKFISTPTRHFRHRMQYDESEVGNATHCQTYSEISEELKRKRKKHTSPTAMEQQSVNQALAMPTIMMPGNNFYTLIRLTNIQESLQEYS